MSLGGIAGMAGLASGVGDVNATPNRNPTSEFDYSLNALESSAPRVLGLEQLYQPQFADLANRIFSQGAGGALSAFQNLQPGVNALNTGAKTAAVGDLNALAPGIQNAWRVSNPQMAKLLDSLTGTAQSQLDAGGTLGPDLRNRLQQSYRGAQASRGLLQGRGSAGLEGYMTAQAGQDLLNQRQGMASNALTTARAITPDSISLLSGMPGISPQILASLGMGISGSAGPKMFDPENNYFSSLYSNNYQGQTQSNIASAGNAAGIMNNIGNNTKLGSSGGASGIGLCG